MERQRAKDIFSTKSVYAYFLSVNLIGQEKNPNVIIVLTDDQGWGDLSYNGNTNINTSNLDFLAEKGAVFERFYVSPVCSPTRAELLTGRYHFRMGVAGTSKGQERMDLNETTFAEVFKNAGYSTGMFGKWHSGMQYPYHPMGRGFDEFYGFCSGHWGSYFDPPLEYNGTIVRGEGYLPDDITNKAIDFIDKNKEDPFLLYLAYNTPHSPMQVPDHWWGKINNKNLELYASNEYKEDTMFTKAALAMCENIDWNVGRLLRKLQSEKLEKNTIVIFASDNGPNSYRWNGGLKGIKGSIDEGGVRSPLFIYYPKVIKPGTKISRISGAIDIFPTIVELAGIQTHFSKPLDGVSLTPLLERYKSQWPNRYLFTHWTTGMGVRNQKYFYNNKGELYDIQLDPSQLHDLSNSNVEIKEEMKEILDKWKNEVEKYSIDGNRFFPVGHPDFFITQLPARDGVGFGNIQRSDNSPNCSFFTNWIDEGDKISWNIEVLKSGDYEVEIYYTCSKENIGSEIELVMGKNKLDKKLTIAHDPPLRGMENDRVMRKESYIKDF